MSVYAHRQKAKREKNTNSLHVRHTLNTLRNIFILYGVRIMNPELENHETVLGQGVSMTVGQTEKIEFIKYQKHFFFNKTVERAQRIQNNIESCLKLLGRSFFSYDRTIFYILLVGSV